MGLEQCRDGKSVWMTRLQSLKHNWLQLTSSALLNEWVVSGAKRYAVVCMRPTIFTFLELFMPHMYDIYLLLPASLIFKVSFREVISTSPICTSMNMLHVSNDYAFSWITLEVKFVRSWKVIYGGRSSDKHCLAAKMKRQAVLHIPWHQLALFDPVSLPGNTRAWSSENVLFHGVCVFGQNIC